MWEADTYKPWERIVITASTTGHIDPGTPWAARVCYDSAFDPSEPGTAHVENCLEHGAQQPNSTGWKNRFATCDNDFSFNPHKFTLEFDPRANYIWFYDTGNSSNHFQLTLSREFGPSFCVNICNSGYSGSCPQPSSCNNQIEGSSCDPDNTCDTGLTCKMNETLGVGKCIPQCRGSMQDCGGLTKEPCCPGSQCVHTQCYPCASQTGDWCASYHPCCTSSPSVCMGTGLDAKCVTPSLGDTDPSTATSDNNDKWEKRTFWLLLALSICFLAVVAHDHCKA